MAEETAVVQPDATDSTVNAEESTTAKTEKPASGETDEQADANDGELETDEQKRKSGWVRQRERREQAERERDFWRDQALKGNPSTPAKTPEAPAAKDEYVPLDTEKWQKDNPNATYDDLIKAQARHEARWEVKEALKTERAEQGKSAQQAQFKQRLDDFMDKGIAKHDDFEEVIQSTANRFTPVMTQALLRNKESAEDVAYELASNPGELARIAALDPYEQVEAMSELKAKFAKEKPAAGEKKEPPEPSKAPAPAKTLSKPGGVKPAPSIHDENLSYKDFVKLREGATTKG